MRPTPKTTASDLSGKPYVRAVPSIYQPKPKTMEEKAQDTAREIAPAAVQTFLKAVLRGEVDTVDRLLTTTPKLVYVQDDVTDLSKRTFTRVTGLQYVVWTLDWDMWDVILKYLPPIDATEQIKAYEGRTDLIALHGLQYSFDKLLAEYDNYIKNYASWDYATQCHHWQKGIGAAQAMMPSWLIYAFTEPGPSVPWVKLEVDRRFSRALSNEFENFHSVILSGNGFLRGPWARGYPVECGAYAIIYTQPWVCVHDCDGLSRFKTKSQSKRQELAKILTTTAPVIAPSFHPEKIGGAAIP